MGTYVRAHFEVFIEGYGWQHYSEAGIEQNYELFEKLGLDDGHCENPIHDPIAAVKGFPEDAHIITRLCYDEHSDFYASWFDAVEIRELVEWHSRHLRRDTSDLNLNQYGYAFGHAWKDFVKYKDTWPVDDVRMVFWFDC